MYSNSFLLNFRKEINNIDEKIVHLLVKRKNLILKIAKYKIENNQNIRDMEREKKLLQKLIILGKKHNLNSEYITKLFQLIITESVLTQQALLQKFYNHNKLKISSFSFLGPKGSYSHIAVEEYANRYFKKHIQKECETFEEVVKNVENNKIDYAFLPIENSCSGAINEIFHILQKMNLFIIGETNILVNHCILGIKNSQLNKIKKIYSHPQPFKQCSQFISQFSNWKIKYTKSTASAMKKILIDNDVTCAALGSERGGQIYHLNILANNIANQDKNITKFIILAKNQIKVTNKIPAKTSILLKNQKKSDDLKKVLSILQTKNFIFKTLNFCNTIEEISYIEIQSNIDCQLMQETIRIIKQNNLYIKILGCYPNENIMPVTP